MRETSLLVDNLSVMMDTMTKMLLWFAGVWGTLLVKPLLILSLDQSLAPLRWTMCSAQATKLPSKNALISRRITVVPMREQASSAHMEILGSPVEGVEVNISCQTEDLGNVTPTATLAAQPVDGVETLLHIAIVLDVLTTDLAKMSRKSTKGSRWLMVEMRSTSRK